MCGRSAFVAEIEQVLQQFSIAQRSGEQFIFEARYNIAPSYQETTAPGPWIVRQTASGDRAIEAARWWFIPNFWTKPLSQLPSSFNARAEEVANKPFYREAFRARRCIVPASGWYEFRGAGGRGKRKESYFFSLPDRPLFGFAGIYDTWISPDGEVVRSFAIITTTPNEIASKVHDRMPVVLSETDYDQWLDPKNNDVGALQTLLKPLASAAPLQVFQTTGYGNDSRHEGPACLEPAAQYSLLDAAMTLPKRSSS